MPVTKEQANAVKDRVVAYYREWAVPVFAFGLTKKGEGYAVKLNVACSPNDLPPLPDSDGVPVLIDCVSGGADFAM